MKLFQHLSPLTWGKLDLPLHGLSQDWFGNPISSPFCFSLASDPESLWFVAAHARAGTSRPGAQPGIFTEGLWEWDVAELFIRDSSSETYLEFNLAPNGSWWAAQFDSARHRSLRQPDFVSHVVSYASIPPEGGWCAALRISLRFLDQIIDRDHPPSANVTAILESPAQRFVSAAPLPGPNPDFHQPSHFLKLAPSES